jgi:hypothetical protein
VARSAAPHLNFTNAVSRRIAHRAGNVVQPQGHYGLTERAQRRSVNESTNDMIKTAHRKDQPPPYTPPPIKRKPRKVAKAGYYF